MEVASKKVLGADLNGWFSHTKHRYFGTHLWGEAQIFSKLLAGLIGGYQQQVISCSH